MMSKPVLMICFLIACVFLKAQDINVPLLVSSDRPRYLAGNTGKEYFEKLIASADWVTKIYDQSKKGIEEYVNRHQTDSTWIVSN